MKNLLFSLVVITLVSCNEQLDTEEDNLGEGIKVSYRDSRIWQLVGMSGMMPDSYTTGSDMSWQEAIVLGDEGVFMKYRETNGDTIQAGGTYTWEQETLKLTYAEENELIGNCTGTLAETYHLKDEQLIGNWWACDGPGLFYELIQTKQ